MNLTPDFDDSDDRPEFTPSRRPEVHNRLAEYFETPDLEAFGESPDDEDRFAPRYYEGGVYDFAMIWVGPGEEVPPEFLGKLAGVKESPRGHRELKVSLGMSDRGREHREKVKARNQKCVADGFPEFIDEVPGPAWEREILSRHGRVVRL